MAIAKVAAVVAVLLAASALAQTSSNKVVLISEKEAQLPAASIANMTFRAGITRGPKVVVVLPSGSDASGHSPVHLEFRFEAHGGAKIDPASVKITYLKTPTVDLTERIKSFIGPNEIDVPAAEVPPGNHPIRVEVKDSEGRSGSAIFTLKISP